MGALTWRSQKSFLNFLRFILSCSALICSKADFRFSDRKEEQDDLTEEAEEPAKPPLLNTEDLGGKPLSLVILIAEVPAAATLKFKGVNTFWSSEFRTNSVYWDWGASFPLFRSTCFSMNSNMRSSSSLSSFSFLANCCCLNIVSGSLKRNQAKLLLSHIHLRYEAFQVATIFLSLFIVFFKIYIFHYNGRVAAGRAVLCIDLDTHKSNNQNQTSCWVTCQSMWHTSLFQFRQLWRSPLVPNISQTLSTLTISWRSCAGDLSQKCILGTPVGQFTICQLLISTKGMNNEQNKDLVITPTWLAWTRLVPNRRLNSST